MNIINDKIDDIIKIKEIDEDPKCLYTSITHECVKDNIFKNIKQNDHIKILNTNTYCKVVNKISSTEIVVDKFNKSIKGESFINLNLQNTILFN